MTTSDDTGLAKSLFDRCAVETVDGEKCWDAHLLLRDVNLLWESAEACKKIIDDSVDCICALGTSGLGLATAVSLLVQKPLIWMQNANSNMLAPTGVDIRGDTVAIVDDHICLGVNVCQYCLSLESIHEARVSEIITLVDADVLIEDGQPRKRENYIIRAIEKYGGVKSVLRLSECNVGDSTSAQTFVVPEFALKRQAWRFQKTPIKPNVAVQSTMYQDVTETTERVELLAIPHREDIMGSLKVTPYWADPWWLLFRQDLISDVARGILMTVGTVFNSIAAVSFWALPFAVLLAKELEVQGHIINSIICLDEEHPNTSDPVRVSDYNCLLVDDSLKSGNHLRRALDLIDSLNISAPIYLAILHNLAWLNKRPLQSILGSTR